MSVKHVETQLQWPSYEYSNVTEREIVNRVAVHIP